MSFLLEPQDTPTSSDYLQIGPVALKLSAEDIQISRVQNDEEVGTLRSRFPILVKKGSARIDVNLSWKALKTTTNGTADYSQWEDVRTIAAMVRSAPFQVVQNQHIRSYLASLDAAFNTASMGFALRELEIKNSADVIDALDCRLSLSVFNYLPYTPDMYYLASDGGPVQDPRDSDIFLAYLSSWKKQNLDKPPAEFTFANWLNQPTDLTSFSYREYNLVIAGEKGIPTGLADDGWQLDYALTPPDESYFNNFLYRDHAFSVGGSGFEPDTTLITSVSVLITNRLAQIPLSGYQYSTFQHLGPATTQVSLGFQMQDQSAPFLADINTAVDTLNRTYFSLSRVSRRVDSIHRMQALFVQNQILNMLGIYSVSPKNVYSETVPDSAIIQGMVSAIHYENYYETVDAYRVRSPQADHAAVLNQLADAGEIAKIAKSSPDTQQVADFFAAKQAHDLGYLAQQLYSQLQLGTKGAASSLLDSFPQIAMPGVLNPEQTQVLYNLVTTSASSANLNAPQLSNFGIPSTPTNLFSQPAFGSVWPALANKVTSKQPLSYTDCILLAAWQQKQGTFMSPADTTTFNQAMTQINAWAAAQKPNSFDSLYGQLFKVLSNSSFGFSRAVDLLQASPQFGRILSQTAQFQGPGNDPQNEGHGGYADMGLKTTKIGNLDAGPAMYFYDHARDIKDQMWDNCTKEIPGLLAPSVVLNRTDKPGIITESPTNSLLASASAQTGIQPGNPLGIMMRSNVPGTTMAEAYPTFKLFLFEDANTLGTFQGFDNFYSYASVKEIEIIRYRDKPDTALIQLTNIAGTLSHRLYDNTASGIKESEADMSATAMLDDSGAALNDPGTGTKSIAFRSIDGQPWVEGKNGKATPLKYYALQTGSKIQIRFGFSNNPDKLWPIFTGMVTELSEENEIITLEAQSFLLELTTPSADEVRTNSWGVTSAIGNLTYAPVSFENAIYSLFHGRLKESWGQIWQGIWPFHRSKAYGGFGLFTKDANTDSIIADMLKVTGARHFGHWQINAQGDTFAKGFLWQDLPKVGIGSIRLGTSYDRSAENILLNQFLNIDGSVSTGTLPNMQRPWALEQQSFFPAQYSIPASEAHRPPWDFIRDVARHYPDYILKVEDYGFPFGADATLVFAQMNDWYRSRPTLPGDYEVNQPNDHTDLAAFATWWNGIGRSQFTQILPVAYEALPLWNRSGISDPQTEAQKIDQTQSYEEFHSYIFAIKDGLNNFLVRLGNSLSNHGILGAFFNDKSSFTSNDLQKANQSVQALAALLDQAAQFVQAGRAALTSGTSLESALITPAPDRSVQPVCRFHFVDSQTIIHNGLAVNDKIFNTVKVGDDTYCANENIPAHHRRLLDCNPMLIDPQTNLATAAVTGIRQSVAASFLMDEVGKMYKGEIILRPIPSLKPYDILMLDDGLTGISGPIQVDSVIHSFSQEMGMVTIVRPRAVVLVNQVFTQNLMAATWYSFKSASASIRSSSWFEKSYDWFSSTTLGEPNQSNPVFAPIAGSLFGGIGSTMGALAAAGGMFGLVTPSSNLMPVIVCPVGRFNRPWLGGLEGYIAGGLITNLRNKLDWFYVDEIAPLIDSWNTASQILSPVLSPNPWATKPAHTAPFLDGPQPAGQTASQQQQWVQQIRQMAQQAGLNPDTVVKLAHQESGVRQWDKSGQLLQSAAGACGIMQLTPQTAAQFGVNYANPNENIQGGINCLASYTKMMGGDLVYGVAAYNAGPGTIHKFRKTGILWKQAPETINYVKSILGIDLVAYQKANG